MKQIIQGAAAQVTIGVVAPAGPSAAARVELITPWLAARGFKAKIFPGCHENIGYLAGADARRAADINAAFADPEVDAIICMRGGYGAARLLDLLDYELIRAHPKPFIGYSDITSLHIVFNQLCGMPTIHAPMLCSDFVVNNDEDSADALFALLAGGLAAGSVLPHDAKVGRTVIGGKEQGRLMGGNLSVIVASLGTPYAIDATDSILFLEEVGEDPYRVDRMLTQLRHAGVLSKARGFVVGSFSDAEDASEVIEQMLAPLGKPLVMGWQAGHCVPNYPLAFGVRVDFDADGRTITLT